MAKKHVIKHSIVYAIAIALITYFANTYIRGPLNSIVVIFAATQWGIKGGILMATWATSMLTFGVIFTEHIRISNLISGALTYFTIGLALGKAIDILRNKKRELEDEIEKCKEIQQALIESRKELKEKAEEQQLLLDNIDVHIWYLTDPKTYAIVNEAHAKFFNKRKCELERASMYSSWSKEEADMCIAGTEEVFEKRVQVKKEEWLTNYEGEKRLMLVTKTPKLGEGGEVKYVVCTAQDITERNQAEESIKKLAYKDSLTGLYNRTYFDEQMIMIEENITEYAPVSIISVDLDGLKIVNDTFGHKSGDDFLKAAADIIAKAFRKTDIIARVGGDEVCIILPKSDNKVALKKRSDILELIENHNRENPSTLISMSIGTATTRSLESIYDVYKRADDNMYEYKLAQATSPKSKVIDLLVAALAERDYMASGHGERLSKMGEIMADKIGLDDDIRRNLIVLAKVHDLGKVGIPDQILFKKGKLTEEEYKKMKEHVKIGWEIAHRSKELENMAELILHHHECWDGKGYPNGLKGNNIPIECRILNIMDAYDTMISDRPYQKGISKQEAIEELIRCSGTQFDPQLLREFIEVIKYKEAMEL
ncbi:HD domain-containing phosphohydrolase [Clostridium sp. HMP27]|uniref:sensor domain-containing diguanylate cyclase/phosphohydrolase n=1 Tax=Clostridium sp. HMP27 TaxID=1487921 RepID=UPI00068D6B3E|nr:HD domain-containing phosphohydrolase [Clostridium sp. HMP27]